MNVRSVKGKSENELVSSLENAIADGFSPSLAFGFVSIHQDREMVRNVFLKYGIDLFAATSNGAFLDEVIDKNESAFLLMDMDRQHYLLSMAEFEEKNFRGSAAKLANQALAQFKNPAILIAGSGLETDAESLLFGFADVIGKDVNIHGCMAGDDFSFSKQYVFDNNRETYSGVLMLAFDGDRVKIEGRATCGWNAVGTVKTVTKSEGNHVYTVDDVPVLDLTAKYGGLELTQSDSFSIEVASQLPLQLQRESGDPVMRPGLFLDWNDRSFYCSGNVPEGSKVRFSLPPDFDVIEKVIQSCEDLKKERMPEADAVVIFSCAGRLVALGPMIETEILGMSKVWNVPMVGLFSNAELARANGGQLEMHNLTTCVVAIKEI